jgi:hypothetical protein
VMMESLHPTVTASGTIDETMLVDGDLNNTAKLAIPKSGENAWIQYKFAEPQTIRSITIVMRVIDPLIAFLGLISNPEVSFESSDDGNLFRHIATLPVGGAPPAGGAAEQTVSFLPVTARYFRVTFKRTPAPSVPVWWAGFDPSAVGMRMGPPPTDYEIAELVLHPGARVNRFEEKAAFAPVPDLYQFKTPEFATTDVVAKSDVNERYARLDAPDGQLVRTSVRLFAFGCHQRSGDGRGYRS